MCCAIEAVVGKLKRARIVGRVPIGVVLGEERERERESESESDGWGCLGVGFLVSRLVGSSARRLGGYDRAGLGK